MQPHEKFQTSNDLQPLLRESDVALILGVSRRTLQNWRNWAEGPAWIRVGALIRYRPAEVARWIGDSEVHRDER